MKEDSSSQIVFSPFCQLCEHGKQSFSFFIYTYGAEKAGYTEAITEAVKGHNDNADLNAALKFYGDIN